MNVFDFTLGHLFETKGGPETELKPGDHIKVVHSGEPNESLVVEREGERLWFKPDGHWVQEWALGDIDAPDLFILEVVRSVGLRVDTDDHDNEWVIRKKTKKK